jgi:hypothetical protein
MKIKAKVKDDTAMEKRNTSIVIFTSVAIIPVVLTFLLGLGLGRGDTINTNNLHAQVRLLERQIDSLQQARQNYSQDLILLDRTLFQMDTLLVEYKTSHFKELKEDLKAAEREREIDSWERDMEDKFDEFDHAVDRSGRKVEFENTAQMNRMLDYVKRWFTEIRRAKEDEFIATKDIVKRELGVEASVINEDKLKALEDELDECEQKLYAKDNAISGLQKDLSQTQFLSQKDIDDEKETILELQGEIGELKSNALKASEDIVANLDAIRGELSSLKGQKWLQLKKDDGKVDALKDKVEIKLLAVERSALGLK